MQYNHLPAEEVCSRTLALQREIIRHNLAILWKAGSFRATEGEPMTVRRAKALNAVLGKCALPIIPGEVFLGSGLGKFSATCDEPQLKAAQEYLKTIGARSFGTNSDHAAPDYARLVAEGLGGIRQRASESMQKHSEPDRKLFLESVIIALDGASGYITRWSEAAAEAALREPEYSEILRAQSRMLAKLSDAAPETLREAMQLVLLAHSMMQLDDRYAMALGRIDQFFYPFYQADLAAGRITPDEAQLLMDHFIAKLAHCGDIQNICAGGVDIRGNDATNELSYMVVNSVMLIGQPGANLTVRIDADTPMSFIRKCAESIRTGIGFPAVFNDDVEIPGLVDQGWPVEDARSYCFVGCIEIFAQGKQAPWSDSRFNLLRCLDLALRRGVDGLTGERAGPDTGEPTTWSDLIVAFREQVRHGIAEHVKRMNGHKQPVEERAFEFTSPLLSALVQDCIGRGLDQCMGGAIYPSNHGIACMGIGSVADSLAAIKRFVYDRQQFTLDQLREMLNANFEGFEKERTMLLRQAPKYGNDDNEVDAIAVEAAAFAGRECLKHRTPTGGRYWALMAANVSNIHAGREVGATADGRRSMEPLSDAASPAFGRDVHGATATVRSISKLDYRLAPGGNVVNMKFHPSALEGDHGLDSLATLIRGCFDLGGIQMQFNTTDREVMRKAMEHPEDYSNLVVRVSGFSAYFVNLGRAVQEDILARTEHA